MKNGFTVVFNPTDTLNKNELSVFFRYLKENGAFSQYIKAINGYQKKPFDFLKQYKHRAIHILRYSFTWDQTQQGHIYWRILYETYAGKWKWS